MISFALLSGAFTDDYVFDGVKLVRDTVLLMPFDPKRSLSIAKEGRSSSDATISRAARALTWRLAGLTSPKPEMRAIVREAAQLLRGLAVSLKGH